MKTMTLGVLYLCMYISVNKMFLQEHFFHRQKSGFDCDWRHNW